MSSAHAQLWVPRLLVFALGLLAALMLLADDIGLWWALRTSVRAQSLATAERLAPAPKFAASHAGTVAPAYAARDAVSDATPNTASETAPLPWAVPPNALDWLPVLQAHGLQLQRLQHNAPRGQGALGADGSELSLTLQGHWRDWLTLERQAPALLAGWLPQSWQVQALGPPAAPGQVQLQWQLRWSGAARASATAASEALGWADTAADASHAEATSDAATAARVFTAPAVLAELSAHSEEPRARAATSAPWRLLGVWQQAGAVHAIVQGAGQVHALSPGQVLGRSALRVQRIEDGQVWLSEGQAAHLARPWALGTAP